MFKLTNKVAPPKRVKLGRPTVYPFPQMEVGDSFLVPFEKVASARACASYHAKKTKRKFTVKENKNTARIWRVA